MVKLLSCLQGHFWESAEAADGAGVQHAFCPVCGGIADSLPLLDLAPSEAPVSPPLPPQALPLRDQAGRPVVAGYEILEELGRGPTGLLCYRARQQGVGRNVLLHVSVAREDPGQLIWGSLRSESSALGKLSHPHIIQLLDIGERDRQLFYNVLEWIEGQPLAKKMAEGPLPLPWVVSLMETLARAVHYAHERGVVHRSLKPASIILQTTDRVAGGELRLTGKDKESIASPATRHPPLATLAGLFPRIVDWGLGRRPTEGDTCDLDLQRGLPFYLSPEQVWGRVKEIGPLCDVFSLGAILFELLAGQPPHKAGQPSEVLDKIQSEEAPVPSAVAEGKFRSLVRSAGDLELICKKCLRKDPRRRYASALELAEDLQLFARGKPIKARPGGSQAQRAGWWFRRHAGAVLVTLLIVGSLIAVPIAYNAGKGQRGNVFVDTRPRDESFRLRQELQQAQQSLQMTQYARSLALVQRDLDADLLPRAREQLDALPHEQQHWEWFYLHARATRQIAQRKLLSCNSNVLALACSPTSRYLAVSAGVDPEQPIFAKQAQSELHIWNFFNGREENDLPHLTGVVRALTFSPTIDTLALASANVNFNIQSAEVLAWNVEFPREPWPRVRVPSGRACSLAWTPNGKLLALDRDGTLREIESSNGVMSSTRQTSPNEPWREARANLPLAVCGGGGNFSVAVLATDGQTIHILDPWRNYASTDLRGHTDRVTGLAGTPTLNRLASVSRDGTLRIWETPTGREKHVLRGHRGEIISAVVFSADGKRVITCGQDNMIRVWEPNTGVEVLTLPMSETNLLALALTPDSRQLVVAHGSDVSVLGPGR